MNCFTENVILALGFSVLLGMSTLKAGNVNEVNKPIIVSSEFVSKIDNSASFNIADMNLSCSASRLDAPYATDILEMQDEKYIVNAYKIANGEATYIVFLDYDTQEKVHSVFYEGVLHELHYRVQGNLLCLPENYDGETGYIVYDTSKKIYLFENTMFDIVDIDISNQSEQILFLGSA